MSRKGQKSKQFSTEPKKIPPKELYMAIEAVVQLTSEDDRDKIEDAIMNVLCDCIGKTDPNTVCRMQYMGGTTGSLDDCFRWLDPEGDYGTDEE